MLASEARKIATDNAQIEDICGKILNVAKSGKFTLECRLTYEMIEALRTKGYTVVRKCHLTYSIHW